MHRIGRKKGGVDAVENITSQDKTKQNIKEKPRQDKILKASQDKTKYKRQAKTKQNIKDKPSQDKTRQDKAR